MSAPQNPAAFPLNTGNKQVPGAFDPHEGMTLRDYFAAKALAALISHPDKDYQNRGEKSVPKLAQWAYQYADAMLKARQS